MTENTTELLDRISRSENVLNELRLEAMLDNLPGDQLLREAAAALSDARTEIQRLRGDRKTEWITALTVALADRTRLNREIAAYRDRAEINPISGYSSGRVNVWGDSESIDAVSKAMNDASMIHALRHRISEAEEIVTQHRKALIDSGTDVLRLAAALHPFSVAGEECRDMVPGLLVTVAFKTWARGVAITNEDLKRAADALAEVSRRYALSDVGFMYRKDREEAAE